jgi:hypothetical protein
MTGPEPSDGPAAVRTARAIFTGPSIVLGGIIRRYRIDAILLKAFGEDAACDILSLAWYITSEGAAHASEASDTVHRGDHT